MSPLPARGSIPASRREPSGQTLRQRIGIERALSVFDGKEQCPSCDGQGFWLDDNNDPIEGYTVNRLTCAQCHGEGAVIREPCIACGAPITQDYEHSNEEHDAGCPVVEEVQR